MPSARIARWFRPYAPPVHGQYHFHLAHEGRIRRRGDAPHPLLPGFDGVFLTLDAWSRGISIPPPSIPPSDPLTTVRSTGHVPPAVRYRRYSPSALRLHHPPRTLAPLQCRREALAHTPLADLLHRTTATTHPLRHFSVDQAVSAFAFVRPQQHLGVTATMAASRPRFTSPSSCSRSTPLNRTTITLFFLVGGLLGRSLKNRRLIVGRLTSLARRVSRPVDHA